MKRLLATGLAISAVALIAPRAANAAPLTIDDSLETGILFSVGQFDTGVGFVLDGTLLLAPSLGTASRLVSEGTPFTFNTNITASAISDAEAVPEPATLLLFGTALLGVLRYSRRKR